MRLKYLRVDGQLRICSGLLVDLARAVWFETAEIDLRGDLLVEAPHVWLHPHINRERPPDWSAGEFVPTPRFRWNLETVSRVVKGRIVIGRERWGFSLYDPATDSFEDRPWPLPRVKEPVGQG